MRSKIAIRRLMWVLACAGIGLAGLQFTSDVKADALNSAMNFQSNWIGAWLDSQPDKRLTVSVTGTSPGGTNYEYKASVKQLGSGRADFGYSGGSGSQQTKVSASCCTDSHSSGWNSCDNAQIPQFNGGPYTAVGARKTIHFCHDSGRPNVEHASIAVATEYCNLAFGDPSQACL